MPEEAKILSCIATGSLLVICPRQTALRTSWAGRFASDGTYLAAAKLGITKLWLSLYFGGRSSCCKLFLGHLATDWKCIDTTELVAVIVRFSKLVLLRQLFIGHVATEAGSTGSASRTGPRAKPRRLRLDVSPAVKNR